MKVFLGIIEVYLGLLDAALVVTSLSLVITRPNDWLLQCFVFILFIFLLSWGLFKIDKKRKIIFPLYSVRPYQKYSVP